MRRTETHRHRQQFMVTRGKRGSGEEEQGKRGKTDGKRSRFDFGW